MQLLYNPRCSKCRQAVAFLDAHGLNYTLRDYIKEPLSLPELRLLEKRLGLPATEWMRRVIGETTDERLEAIIQEPELLQRPIAIKGDRAWVVRTSEALDRLLTS